MEFVNETPFPAIAFDSIDQRDMLFHTVVIRITFTVAADGTLDFAEEQTPLATCDEYFGEINRSSVRQESDFAPFKPHTDVIVIGNAFAPQMRPRPQFHVGLAITDAPRLAELPPEPYGLSPNQSPSLEAMRQWRSECAMAIEDANKPKRILGKRLLVSGPRQWRRRLIVTRALSAFALPAWTLSSPKPIVELPLRYEYAYGGENRILVSDPDAKRVAKKMRGPGLKPQAANALPADQEIPAIAHAVYPANPVGSGYAESWFIKAARKSAVRAPQIESPDERIGRFDKPYYPQSFGIVGRAWQSRLPLAGTYDEQWRTERHPNLPRDFDFRYWNCAPPDQQVTPYLDGNETITLTNLCPPATPGARTNAEGDTELAFTLPGHLPFVLVRFDSGILGELPARLDTVMVDAAPDPAQPDKSVKVICVWRATVAIEPEVRVLEARMIAKEDVDALRAEALQRNSPPGRNTTPVPSTATA